MKNDEITQFSYELSVPAEAVDQNRHVNNVMYVQWMQDAAVKHFDFLGGTSIMQEVCASWFVREHNIKYLNPAFEGDILTVTTQVTDMKRVRCTRTYTFTRKTDNKTIVAGETDWVFVDAETGRPKVIPQKIRDLHFFN